MSNQEQRNELTSFMEEWTKKHEEDNYDPVPYLNSWSEKLEKAAEEFHKQDPDPFDDRHPAYSYPSSSYGPILKFLTKQDAFMEALVSTYIKPSRSSAPPGPVCEAAARCLLAALPGLDGLGVFTDNPDVLPAVYQWAKTAEEPLCTYATGILAFAVEHQEIISDHHSEHALLVPILLQRLWNLIHPGKYPLKTDDENNSTEATTSQLSHTKETTKTTSDKTAEAATSKSASKKKRKNSLEFSKRTKIRRLDKLKLEYGLESNSVPASGAAQEEHVSPFTSENMPLASELYDNDVSNSSWVDMKPVVIGCSFNMAPPLTADIQERTILDFLRPLGEYQDLLSIFLEYNVLELIKHYLSKSSTNEGQLTFSALRFFASLLCHNKVATGFIENHGIQRLLSVRRPSRGATGVSLCLYYLAYNRDAMERVCQLPNKILHELVKYATWLLECSHESGRCHATLFFSITLEFPQLLRHFDNRDGLRYLLNTISTLSIMRTDVEQVTLDDDTLYTCRLAARNTCVTIKKYLETHLTLKVDKVKAILRRKVGTNEAPENSSKVIESGDERVLDNLDFLLSLNQPNPAFAANLLVSWPEIENFMKLDGVKLMLQVIALACDWTGQHSGRTDTVKSALDSLAVATLVPKAQKQLCEKASLPPSVTEETGISIILGVAEGDAYLGTEPEAQKSALTVLINCVCGPEYKFDGAMGKVVNGTPQTKMVAKSVDENRRNLWESVKTNNGIKILLQLLMVTQPSIHADVIRMLACKALCGLSRCESVKQIISKLPTFNNGQIQLLTRTPIMQDLRKHHARFCKYMEELTARVSGKPRSAHMDLQSMLKAHIVSQTVIRFDNRELLQMIHDHLDWSGLHGTAASLAREASLHVPTTTSVGAFHTPKGLPRNGLSGGAGDASSSFPFLTTPPSSKKICFSRGSHASTGGIPTTPSSTHLLHTPTQKKFKIRIRGGSNGGGVADTPNSGERSPGAVQRCRLSGAGRVTVVQPGMLDMLQETERRSTSPQPTLSTIVADYLKNQHSQCKHPVVTVPEFSLFRKHYCPEPRFRVEAPLNLASRCMRRQVAPRFGGVGGAACDRQFIYSRFCPSVAFRFHDEEQVPYTCCAFMPDDREIIMGNYQGDLCVRRLDNEEHRMIVGCANATIIRVEPRRDARKALLVADGVWRSSCSLFCLEGLENSFTYTGATYAEFSKRHQDRVVGTKKSSAMIFDASTGQKTQTLERKDMANHYQHNRATFSYDDELVLSDGLLWDVRTSGNKPIHKFDKFSNNVSGLFHPQGLEVIINTEVWDLRNYHLLHTVPSLDDCTIRFNSDGTILYAAQTMSHLDLDDVDADELANVSKTFQAIDGQRYCPLSVTDTKHQINDFAVDNKDFHIAVVERQTSDHYTDLPAMSVCRLYEVGRVRGDDHDDDEDDDEMVDDGDEDDDGSDDDGSSSADGADDDDNDVDGDGGSSSSYSTIGNPSSFDDDISSMGDWSSDESITEEDMGLFGLTQDYLV